MLIKTIKNKNLTILVNLFVKYKSKWKKINNIYEKSIKLDSKFQKYSCLTYF